MALHRPLPHTNINRAQRDRPALVNFLYDLSLWQLTLFVLGVSLAVGLGFSVGIRTIFRMNPSAQQADLAIDLMQVTSTYIGILLAFAGVLAWEDYKGAENAIQKEAATASQLYRDFSVYGPEMAESRQDLRAYIGSIVVDEWPLLREGKRSSTTETMLLRLFDDFADTTPTDGRKSAIYQEAFSQLNELVALRRDRITSSRSEIPAVLWIVAIAGSVLTIAYASAFVGSRYALLMISGTSLTIGLLFLFLLSVDNPFRGRAELSNEQFRELSSIFDTIDRFPQRFPQSPPGRLREGITPPHTLR
jgi:hypothetical protein